MINKIKNYLYSIKLKIQYDLVYRFQEYLEDKKYKKLYSDYKRNEYNAGRLKFIWGIKSCDDFTGKDANLYTMNDIDITYDRDSKLYMIGIETVYMFKENRKQGECKYLRQLLDAFTQYMIDNNYSTNEDLCLFLKQPTIESSAESIEELYISFKIFVEGYCKTYGY